jgi:hypothetical protein
LLIKTITRRKTLKTQNLVPAILVAVVVLFNFGTSAEAQQPQIPEMLENGRPDPTGQDRYQQFGKPVPYPSATILAKLPKGAKCAPAGELVDVPLWNTTKEGYAIVSVLTEKAEVAVFDERKFLCKCISGFNELFVPERHEEETLTETADAVVERTMEDQPEPEEPTRPLVGPPAPRASAPPPDDHHGHFGTKSKIAVGTLIVAVLTKLAIDHFDKDNSVFGVRTDGKCVTNSGKTTCSTAPQGTGFSIRF